MEGGNGQNDFTQVFQKFQKQDTFIKKLFDDILTVQQKDWAQEMKRIDKSSNKPISPRDIAQMLALIDSPENPLMKAGEKLKQIEFQSEFFVILVTLLDIVSKKTDKDTLKKEDEQLRGPELQEQVSEFFSNQWRMLEQPNDALSRTFNHDSSVGVASVIGRQIACRDDSFSETEQDISIASRKSQVIYKESLHIIPTVHPNGQFLRILKTLEGRTSYILAGMYREIKRLYPHDFYNRLLLGKLYLTLQFYRLALREFDEVYEQAPEKFVIDYYRGLCLKGLNKMQPALKMMKSVIWAPNVNHKHSIVTQAFFEAGLISISLFKYFEAMLYFKRCLDLNPNNYRAYYQYLYSLSLGEQYRQAYSFIKENQWISLQLTRQRPIIAAITNNLIARILNECGQNFEKANSFFDNAIKQYNYEHLLRKPGKDRNEYAWYDDENNFLRFVFLQRGQAFLKQNKLHEAITDFKEAKAKGQPANILPTTFLLVCYYKLIAQNKGQDQGTKDTLTSKLSECILQIFDWFNKYQLVFPIKHLKQALELIQKDKIIEQMSDKINQELKQKSIDFQYKCEIIHYIEDMIKALTGAMMVERIRQCDSGSFLLLKGKPQLAKKCFQFVLKSGPAIEIYVGLGKACFQLAQYDQAQRYFKLVYTQQQNNIDALKGLKSIYQIKGKNTLYEDFLRKLLAQCPEEQHQYQRQLSFVYFRNKKIAEGKHFFILSLQQLQITQSCYTLLKQIYLNKYIQSNDEIFNKMNQKISASSQSQKNRLLKLYTDLRIKSQARKIILQGPPISKKDRVQYCMLFFKFIDNHEFTKKQIEDFRFIIDLLGEEIAKKNANLIKQLADLYYVLEAYDIALPIYKQAIEQYDKLEAWSGFNQCFTKIRGISPSKEFLERQIEYLAQTLYGFQQSMDYCDPTRSFSSMYPSSVGSSQLKTFNRNPDVKRLCYLCKEVGDSSDYCLKALQEVITFKPLNYEYLQMLISLQMKLNCIKQSLPLIQIFIKNDPSNPFIYTQLQHIVTRREPNLNRKQVSDKIHCLITGELHIEGYDTQVVLVFFYFFLEMYDQSLDHFKGIVLQIKASKFKDKREEIVKLIGHLQKAKNRYLARDILIIMRALIHRANQNMPQEFKTYGQLTKCQKQMQTVERTYPQWFSQFVPSISGMSVENQAYLIFYVIKFLQSTKHQERQPCEEVLINLYQKSNPSVLTKLDQLSCI